MIARNAGRVLHERARNGSRETLVPRRRLANEARIFAVSVYLANRGAKSRGGRPGRREERNDATEGNSPSRVWPDTTAGDTARYMYIYLHAVLVESTAVQSGRDDGVALHRRGRIASLQRLARCIVCAGAVAGNRGESPENLGPLPSLHFAFTASRNLSERCSALLSLFLKAAHRNSALSFSVQWYTDLIYNSRSINTTNDRYRSSERYAADPEA